MEIQHIIVVCVSYEVDVSYLLVANKPVEIYIILLHFGNISELCLDLNNTVISEMSDDLSEVLKGTKRNSKCYSSRINF